MKKKYLEIIKRESYQVAKRSKFRSALFAFDLLLYFREERVDCRSKNTSITIITQSPRLEKIKNYYKTGEV